LKSMRSPPWLTDILVGVTEVDEEEKTDADRTGGRHEAVQGQEQEMQEWGQDDRTEVDAKPPVDAPTELAKPR
jgi:hypothetical protein